MIGIEVTRRAELAQTFLQQTGITFPVAEDRADVATSYGVTGTPTNFLVDRRGKVMFQHVGYAPGSEAELRAQIEYLLSRRPPA